MTLYLRHQNRAGGFWTKSWSVTQSDWILSESQMLLSPVLTQANALCSLESLSGQRDLYHGFAFYQGNSDTIFQWSPEKNSWVTLNQNGLGALTQTSCETWVNWLVCALSFDLYSLSHLLEYQSWSPGNFTAMQSSFKWLTKLTLKVF